MRLSRILPLAAAVLIAAATFTNAAELGMKAPPLEISHWSKGNPIDMSKDQGKYVHVVEFWATWCGPCRTSIPHLSEIQNKYAAKGVRIVGITDEEPKTVDRFVKQMGKKMDYTVAVDKNQTTMRTYMAAFGIEAIPHAFIVDKTGAVVWEGSPMSGMERALNQILAGEYDVEIAKLATRPDGYIQEYFGAIVTGEDTKEVKDKGASIIKYAGGSPDLMNQFAWVILTEERVQIRHLDLALEAAKLAHDATDQKNPAIMDTYARALFDNGKKAEAIKWQRAAIELAPNGESRAGFEKTLKDYEKRASE